jgi:hypothetical protein
LVSELCGSFKTLPGCRSESDAAAMRIRNETFISIRAAEIADLYGFRELWVNEY